MRRVLRYESGSRFTRLISDRLGAGERRRIQIVSEVEAHRTDWCFVADPDPDCVGDVTVITSDRSAWL